MKKKIFIYIYGKTYGMIYEKKKRKEKKNISLFFL